MLAGMLSPLNDRGPDSAGFAVYGAETPGACEIHPSSTVDLRPRAAAEGPARRAGWSGRASFARHARRFFYSGQSAALARRALTAFEEVAIVGAGRRMEIFKEVGRPDDVSRKFGLETMSGTHAIGHTRMATESAVTTNGAHPFTTGDDQCLVHNGSLSNHCAVRRELIKKGLSFQTENDTEVAAGFITAKLKDGGSLQQAMEACLNSLDGFYTFVIGTEAGLRGLARSDRLQARGGRRNRPAGRIRHRIPCASRSTGDRFRQSVGAGAGHCLPLGIALMLTVDLARSSVRELNTALHRLGPDSNETHWRVLNPRGRHSIAVGLDAAGSGRDRRTCRLLLRRHEQARDGHHRGQRRGWRGRKHDVGHRLGEGRRYARPRARLAAAACSSSTVMPPPAAAFR